MDMILQENVVMQNESSSTVHPTSFRSCTVGSSQPRPS